MSDDLVDFLRQQAQEATGCEHIRCGKRLVEAADELEAAKPPEHVRAAMQRLASIREIALRDIFESADRVYPAPAEHYYQDDLRTVAYWAIDQRESDT